MPGNSSRKRTGERKFLGGHITDLEIIKQVLAGERDMYAELVRRHQANITRLCWGFFQNGPLAEETAQDIFVETYKKLARFRGDSAFGTWLYRLATNHCLDVKRKMNRDKTEPLDILVNTPTTSDSSNNKELINHLLSQISDQDRTLLLLREAQGLSYEEMTQVLDCSIDAVKARLKRARQNLQEKYRHFSQIQNV